MADLKLSYVTASDVTITLASLASDTNLLAGRGSTEVVNTTNKYLDYLVSGKITVGTSPAANRNIEIWVVASWDGTNYPDSFGTTDANKTITSTDIKNASCRLLQVLNVGTTTSNRTYFFAPTSVASVFGGVCPPSFLIFVVQNSGVALNATGSNHQIRLQPVYETVA